MEGPVHEVTLSAFFLSKYEMSQGRWKRFEGQNPSVEGPDGRYSASWNAEGKAPTLLEPVESVSWTDCLKLLERMGLALPSEAQWEYGARAGTDTPWWTGEERESLRGAVNLVDRWARQHGVGPGWSSRSGWKTDTRPMRQ